MGKVVCSFLTLFTKSFFTGQGKNHFIIWLCMIINFCYCMELNMNKFISFWKIFSLCHSPSIPLGCMERFILLFYNLSIFCDNVQFFMLKRIIFPYFQGLTCFLVGVIGKAILLFFPSIFYAIF